MVTERLLIVVFFYNFIIINVYSFVLYETARYVCGRKQIINHSYKSIIE